MCVAVASPLLCSRNQVGSPVVHMVGFAVRRYRRGVMPIVLFISGVPLLVGFAVTSGSECRPSAEFRSRAESRHIQIRSPFSLHDNDRNLGFLLGGRCNTRSSTCCHIITPPVVIYCVVRLKKLHRARGNHHLELHGVIYVHPLFCSSNPC